jgi:hypothetical protein
MSLLGSALGRALAGGGSAVSSIASKYIDADLQRERDAALADLQVRTASRMRTDQAAHDDARAPVVRQRAVDDAKAAAGAQDDITLGRANNSVLSEALRRAEDQKAKDATRRRLDAEKTELGDTDLMTRRRQKDADDAAAKAEAQRRVTKESAADADWIKAQKTISMSDPKVRAQIDQARAAAANAFANAESQQMANAAMKRVRNITDDMLKTLDDSKLSPEERAKQLSALQSKLNVLVPRKADKQNTPTEKIVEERDDKGNVIGSTRTVERPLGNEQGGGAPQVGKIIDEALAAGKGAELIATMESQGLSPGDIVRLIGEDEYAKAKASTRAPREKPMSLEGLMQSGTTEQLRAFMRTPDFARLTTEQKNAVRNAHQERLSPAARNLAEPSRLFAKPQP